MDVSFVRQVHQVVDAEAVVAANPIVATVERPGGIGTGPEIGDQGGVGLFSLTDPYPGEAVAFDNRIGLHAGRAGDRVVLKRHLDTAAFAVDQQAVVAAANVVAFLDPHG